MQQNEISWLAPVRSLFLDEHDLVALIQDVQSVTVIYSPFCILNLTFSLPFCVCGSWFLLPMSRVLLWDAGEVYSVCMSFSYRRKLVSFYFMIKKFIFFLFQSLKLDQLTCKIEHLLKPQTWMIAFLWFCGTLRSCAALCRQGLVTTAVDKLILTFLPLNYPVKFLIQINLTLIIFLAKLRYVAINMCKCLFLSF